jgi:hypothetical protein
MEMQVQDLIKTPDEIADGSEVGMNAVDRIALVVTFVVAILIVVMFTVTYRSARHEIPVAAATAISSYVGMPASKSDYGIATTTARGG